MVEFYYGFLVGITMIKQKTKRFKKVKKTDARRHVKYGNISIVETFKHGKGII